MCGNQRRQARMNAYGRCGSRNYDSSYNAGANLSTIIDALQQIKLGSSKELHQDSSTRMRPSELDGQTSGVVIKDSIDQKSLETQQETTRFNFEQLPSYEESTSPRAVRVTSAPASQHYSPPPSTPAATSGAQIIISKLEQFNSGLDKYRQGTHGGKGSAKKAAKALIRDLRDQELEKRSIEQDYHRKGERRQVRRELKPVKQMMKDAVREVKMDRRDRWLSS